METEFNMVAKNLDDSSVNKLRAHLHQAWLEYLSAEAVLSEVPEAIFQCCAHIQHGWEHIALFAGCSTQQSPEGKETSAVKQLISGSAEFIMSKEVQSWKESTTALFETCESCTPENIVLKQEKPSLSTLSLQIAWLREAVCYCNKQINKTYPLAPWWRTAPWGRIIATLASLLIVAYVGASLLFKSWTPKYWASRPYNQFLITKATQDWGILGIDASVGNKPFSVGGLKFEHGLGTHANSKIILNFKNAGKVTSLSGLYGMDDETGGKGSARFSIVNGREVLFKSDIRKCGDPALPFKISIAGLDQVTLIADDAGDGINFDHADWLDLRAE